MFHERKLGAYAFILCSAKKEERRATSPTQVRKAKAYSRPPQRKRRTFTSCVEEPVATEVLSSSERSLLAIC